MAKRMPKLLYHYCSLSTFHSIVNNHSIWLSDIGKSNDSLELKWIKGQCRYYILKAWTEYVKAVFENGNSSKIDFESFENLQNQLDDLYTFETEKCWAFCLSGKKDDLGQWRGYADDGYGISIGFKSLFFKNLSEKAKCNYGDTSTVTFDHIAYKEKDIIELFYDVCGLSLIVPQMNSSEVLAILRKAVFASLALSPFYKNHKFEEEKEWRLVFSTLAKSLIEGKSPKTEFDAIFPDNEIKYGYIVKNNNLISHIEISSQQLINNIAEIWIGPKCKLSTVDVKLFLISAGFLTSFHDNSIQIHKSQASYQ